MNAADNEYMLKMVKMFDEGEDLDWHQHGESYSAVCVQMHPNDHNDDERLVAIRCDPERFFVRYGDKLMEFDDGGEMYRYRQSYPQYEGPTYSLLVMDVLGMWFYSRGVQIPSCFEQE